MTALDGSGNGTLEVTQQPIDITDQNGAGTGLKLTLPVSGAAPGETITGDIDFTLSNIRVTTTGAKTSVDIDLGGGLKVTGDVTLVGNDRGAIDLNIDNPLLVFQPQGLDVSSQSGGHPAVTEIAVSFKADLRHLPDSASITVTTAKDISALVNEPGVKFALLAQSVGAQMGSLRDDVAFGINFAKNGITNSDLGDVQITMGVSQAWFDEKIAQGKRIMIAK
ncbi:MAG: hypothetical protein J4O06_16000, partial [Chloroflexi bacterium]|nr:hypothetical protein [Chloroflexota bacterium]